MRTFVVLCVGVLLCCCAFTFGEDAPKKETPMTIDALERLVRKASDPKLTTARRGELLGSVVGRAVSVKTAVTDVSLHGVVVLITGKCRSRETVTVKIPAEPGITGATIPAKTQKWFKYRLSVRGSADSPWAKNLNKGDWVVITGAITELGGALDGPDREGARPRRPTVIIDLKMSIDRLAKTTAP